MEKLLSKQDIAYDNYNFWWNYILWLNGFDEEKDVNLDEIIPQIINRDEVLPNFSAWFNDFYPENEASQDGYYESPNTITGSLKGGMSFAIEFHKWQTVYYLNDIYIGSCGGHYETKFFTLDELLTFEKYDKLFLLMLPMVGVEKSAREKAEGLISEKLKLLMMFSGHEQFIAKCIVNGLLISGEGFKETENVGITSDQDNCVRNIEKYQRYRDAVIELNRVLSSFVAEQH